MSRDPPLSPGGSHFSRISVALELMRRGWDGADAVAAQRRVASVELGPGPTRLIADTLNR